MTDVKKRFQQIHHEISTSVSAAKRDPQSVQLLAVSKTWPADALREVAALGQRQFGENYLQEALDKIDALADLDLEWHFIGPIQSNKTRDIAGHFDWVQSVDREKIARRLNEHRPDSLAPLNVCIQINIDEEETKSGTSPEKLLTLADYIATLDKLNLRGLMVIPSPKNSVADEKDSFSRAYELFQQLRHKYPQVDTLSMGMTADMSTAIACGSTMVRIGKALFGQRNKR